jgi:hypothetical protein
MTLERWAPVLAAALAFCAALILQGQGPIGALLSQVDLNAVMYTVLGIFAFGASLTLGLFALVLSPRDGFMGRLHGTAAYQAFGEYVARAFILSLAALVATGLMLVGERLAGLRPVAVSLLPVWWALAAGALTSIARTHAIFLIWMRSPVPLPGVARLAPRAVQVDAPSIDAETFEAPAFEPTAFDEAAFVSHFNAGTPGLETSQRQLEQVV